jgi:hypothetical protein
MPDNFSSQVDLTVGPKCGTFEASSYPGTHTHMTDPFATSDVDIAAYLRCKGMRYNNLATNPSNPDIADFVFDASDALWQHLHDWTSATASCAVDAREFGKVRRMFFKTAQRFIRQQHA